MSAHSGALRTPLPKKEKKRLHAHARKYGEGGHSTETCCESTMRVSSNHVGVVLYDFSFFLALVFHVTNERLIEPAYISFSLSSCRAYKKRRAQQNESGDRIARYQFYFIGTFFCFGCFNIVPIFRRNPKIHEPWSQQYNEFLNQKWFIACPRCCSAALPRPVMMMPGQRCLLRQWHHVGDAPRHRDWPA